MKKGSNNHTLLSPGEKKRDFSRAYGTGVGTREWKNFVFLRVMGVWYTFS